MSAYDFMSKSNLENDDLVALYYYGKKYTYSSLMKKIAEVENSLRAYGVKKGDIVSVALPNVPENVFVFYALNKIGAMANMVDLRKKGDMLTSAINDVSSNNNLGISFNKILFRIRTKLKTNGMISFNEYETPIVVLSYILNLYNNMKTNKRTARKELINILPSISSQLRKREIENLIKRLDMIDDNMINEGFLNNALNSFKVSGLKGYENDYYELKFEANNVEDDDQALLLIARINSRMSVIADYLSTEEDIPTNQRVRWTKLLNDYNGLRNQLASEKLRRNKTRLYVNYGFDD